MGDEEAGKVRLSRLSPRQADAANGGITLFKFKNTKRNTSTERENYYHFSFKQADTSDVLGRKWKHWLENFTISL